MSVVAAAGAAALDKEVRARTRAAAAVRDLQKKRAVARAVAQAKKIGALSTEHDRKIFWKAREVGSKVRQLVAKIDEAQEKYRRHQQREGATRQETAATARKSMHTPLHAPAKLLKKLLRRHRHRYISEVSEARRQAALRRELVVGGGKNLDGTQKEGPQMFSLADVKELVSGHRATVHELVEHKAQEILSALAVCPAGTRYAGDAHTRGAEDMVLGSFGTGADSRRRCALQRRSNPAFFQLYSRFGLEEELFELVVEHRVRCLERRWGSSSKSCTLDLGSTQLEAATQRSDTNERSTGDHGAFVTSGQVVKVDNTEVQLTCAQSH